jgi:uncharacterized protein YpuA (DUF1002 family)
MIGLEPAADEAARSSDRMARPDDRRKRGSELLKKYRSSGNDKYAAAADAIADSLLSVAEDPDEARQIVHAAEEDYRVSVEEEGFLGEG